MSHELRTPLNAVLGFVQLLEGDRQLGNGQRRHVRAIRRSSERLLGLVNEVLDLAKIEADRFDLMPIEWDSAEFFQELARMFRVRAGQKGIDFRIEPSITLPWTLSCDTKCLHQVLVNLLDNALKYTEEGGRHSARGLRGWPPNPLAKPVLLETLTETLAALLPYPGRDYIARRLRLMPLSPPFLSLTLAIST